MIVWVFGTTVGLIASFMSVKHGLPMVDAFGLLGGGYSAARLIDWLGGKNRRVSHAHISNIKWGLQHGKEG